MTSGPHAVDADLARVQSFESASNPVRLLGCPFACLALACLHVSFLEPNAKLLLPLAACVLRDVQVAAGQE